MGTNIFRDNQGRADEFAVCKTRGQKAVILADTGFFVALLNRRDDHHGRAKVCLAKLREPLVTTWPVATEVCHLLANATPNLAQRFIESIAAGAATLHALDARHLPRIIELTAQYRDLPMDLADASLVIAAEELGDGRIFSTDRRDFQTYRWKSRKPFVNLMLK
jgi:uncharacterized protein